MLRVGVRDELSLDPDHRLVGLHQLAVATDADARQDVVALEQVKCYFNCTEKNQK